MGLLKSLSRLLGGGEANDAPSEPVPIKWLRWPAQTLRQWRPSLSHTQADYAALWSHAISPTHPILIDRVKERLPDGGQNLRRASNDTALMERVFALSPDAAALLAVEAFERVPLLARLSYCYQHPRFSGFQVGSSGITRGVSPLAEDIEALGECAIRRAGALSDPQVERLAWAVGHISEDIHPNCTVVRTNIALLSPLLLGDASVALSPIRRAALEQLFRRLDNGTRASVKPQEHWALLKALCERLGHSPDDSVYFASMRQVERAAARCRAEIEAAAGPDITPFVRALYDEPHRHDRKFPVGWPETEALEKLTPEQRGAALVGILRAGSALCRQDDEGSGKRAEPVPFFGEWPVEHFINQIEAGADRRQGNPAGAMCELFDHFIGRKVVFTDDDLAETAEFMVAKYHIRRAPRTLKLIKHIERRLVEGASRAFVERIDAVLAALQANPSGHTEAFDRIAPPRLAQALEQAKSKLAEQPAPWGPTAAGGPSFGLRATPPSPPTLELPAAAALTRDFFRRVKAFYDDVCDPRKFTPESIAFLDRLIAEDARPPEPAAPCPHRYGTPEWLDHMTRVSDSYRHPGMFAAPLASLRARIALVSALPTDRRSAFIRLGNEAHSLEGKSSPSRKWLQTARPTLDDLAEPDRIGLLASLLEAYEPSSEGSSFDNALRGLIYLSAVWPAAKVGPLLVSYARKTCFQTIPGIGIRGERHGNACLWSLINMPDGAGVPFLARLHQRVKYPSVKKRIDAALNEAARAAGLSRGALDELSTPTHDLDEGNREITIGEGAALLRVVGTASVEIRWRSPEGRETASVPAALKDAKDEIKAARATAKEIEADLALQVARLQRLFIEDRAWHLAEWRERYADHPLVGSIARRLIWNVVEDGARVSGTLVDGALVDLTGSCIMPGEGATVTPWHPIGCPIAETLAWRVRLDTLGIVQPFKQAHREVYVVTDAERDTGTYSNRFAGHILKQHQMMSLARLNGWRVTHRVWADVENDEPTHLVLAEHGLVAEFWTAGTGGDDPEVSDSQSYTYISTDQVRFYRIADRAELTKPMTARGPTRGAALTMVDVPPIVFSEVMRTCDLFTGVASVANDPDWVNGGADAEHPNQWRRTEGQRYWTAQAFGDLSEAAKARAETLATIVPALAIADRLSLDGRFLTVRGTLRSYRIHIGSGNIMMMPDERYLCIVRGIDTSSGSVPRLPFEGDAMLSLILSKALLLAADEAIIDPSIVRQIRAAA